MSCRLPENCAELFVCLREIYTVRLATFLTNYMRIDQP